MFPIISNFAELAPLNCKELNIILKRIGSQFDGGYVIPHTFLKDAKHLISFGYGNDFEFEKDILSQYPNIKHINIYDKSINLISLLRQCLTHLVLFLLGGNNEFRTSFCNLKKYLELQVNTRINLIHKYVGKSNKDISCKYIIEKLKAQDYSIVLKSDIEGDEYLIIEDILNSVRSISIMIIEFHGLKLNNGKFQSYLNKLIDYFAIVNVNINNNSISANSSFPDAIEVTFLNLNLIKDLNITNRSNSSFNFLNRPNNPNNDQFFFKFI